MKERLISLFKLGVVVIACYIVLYVYTDANLAYWLQPLTNTPLYKIAKVISALAGATLWTAIAAIAWLGIIFIIWHRKKTNLFLQKSLYVCTSVLLSYFISAIVKFSLARHRPIELIQNQIYGFHFFSFKWLYNSTPSGHTAMAFAVATAITLLNPRYRWVGFGVAGIIAVSRLFVMEHYLSDILLGAYIGYASAVLSYTYFVNTKKLKQ